ncbi:hypothetical protein Ga0466249_002803 [Sporomusaceae bacterium BoRhaA]|uniref:hypothetical protein n=1 Tax=Pelorhabdus rhamnosifermentans TaxID=2772457 RepID=UPI001C060F0E|nr:hypothetical protein [Pelorhabdus rhamnosifermentans]MBU2701684.1 hypothetical protein [Pelorhabdus rhamnosifermentans]
MNVDDLLTNIEYALTEATKTLQLPIKSGTVTAPKIVKGYLPTKNPRAEQNDIPCAIARLLSDETTEEGTTAQVKIICIAFSEDDEQGWRELLTIMNPIKTYFLAHRNIGDCYRIALPIKREIPEEQGPPEWCGTFTLNIEIPTALEVNEDVRDFLNNGN